MDNTSTRSVEGTGLGLAIAKKIAELFGGTISLNSEIGKGSTFTATFRIGLIGATTSTEEQGTVKDEEILILDRFPERAEVMARIVNKLGYKTRVYLTSAEPGELCHKEYNPQISNMSLAGISSVRGIIISDTGACLSYLPLLHRAFGSDLPLVFATELFTSRSPERTAAEKLGISVFLDSPIDSEVVAAKIAKALSAQTFERRRSSVKSLDLEAPQVQPTLDKPSNASNTPRVLTVDDNLININVAQRFLKRENITTDTASDGIQAVEAVTKGLECSQPFDIIFLDIHV